MEIYSILGRYYDALVGDEQAVEAWVEWIESFHPGKNVLELACGSGAITARLAGHHDVTALDLSASMLEAAKSKTGSETITFVQGDMRNLDGLGQFDLIGCFCDSFNYLLENEDVEQFFAAVAAHLKDGGLFLFDSHGQSRIEEFANGYDEAGEFDDGTQVQWLISSEGDLIYQDFAFYLPQRTVQEHHLQRVYSLDWLQRALEKHFDILSITGDFGSEPLETCEKYMIACRKKQA